MKKFFISLSISFFLSLTVRGQNIYSISLHDIDGSNISLSAFEGKTLLFVIAPLSGEDTAHFDEIKQFQDRYGTDSVKLIGIMSVEDGFSSGNKSAIKTLYQNKGINILLTEGMYTKKSAGENQSALMQWLTKKSGNSRFETDARGLFHKFCISVTGKICGISPPQNSLFDSITAILIARSRN